MSKMIIINTLFIVYCIGLLVAISSVNTELESAVENRSPSGSMIEVTSTADYGTTVTVEPLNSNKLQQSANNREISLQFAGGSL